MSHLRKNEQSVDEWLAKIEEIARNEEPMEVTLPPSLPHPTRPMRAGTIIYLSPSCGIFNGHVKSTTRLSHQDPN